MTKPQRTEEVRIPKVLGSEKKARYRAASFAAEIGFAADRIEDIKTAVSEASLNAIEHSARGGSLEGVLVRIVGEQDGMQISVSSEGLPFVPSDTKPDIKDKIEGKDRARGWGLYLIQALADEVEVDNKSGVNTVTMRFVL